MSQAPQATSTDRKAPLTDVWIVETESEMSIADAPVFVLVDDEVRTMGQRQPHHDAGESLEADGSHQVLSPGFRLNAPNAGDDDVTLPPTLGQPDEAVREGLRGSVPVASNVTERACAFHLAFEADPVTLSPTEQPAPALPLAFEADPVTLSTTEERFVDVSEAKPHQKTRIFDCRNAMQRHWKVALFTSILSNLLLLAVIIVIILLAQHQANCSGEKDASGPPNTLKSTIGTIKKRETLACGVVESPGLSMYDSSTGNWSGFEVDLCRAVGTVIFGEDGHVNFIATTYLDRFKLLQSGQVDLLAAGASYTMERDLYEPTAKAGFTFSVPYLYNGFSFSGVPKYVTCAEKQITTGNCTGIRICVLDGSSHVQVLKSLFPSLTVMHLTPTRLDFYYSFVKGLCNVLAGEQFDLAARNVLQTGYSGDYSISPNLYSKEPLALVTRDNDAVWSDFVNWVFLALLSAEKQSISQQTAQEAVANPGPAADSTQLPFYQVVATVGNYGEMYERHLESIFRRTPLNQQNNGSTPLILSFPFGNNSAMGLGPVSNGTLQKILKRGYLLCGTADVRFFAKFNYTTQEWGGFDVDYCRAISAAIFKGKGSTVFVPVDGKTRWELLKNGSIDLISWDTTWNYERDIRERDTQTGFTFSPANFYTGLKFGGVPPYGHCADTRDVLTGNCSKLKICVTNGTTTLDVLKHLFDAKYIDEQPNDHQVDECFTSGHAFAANDFSTAEATVREYYKGPYEAGSMVYSQEHLAIVTRQDDLQWSSFVNWIVMATFYAAEENITQSTYRRMPTTNLFGPDFAVIFQHAILAVGSHSEILARNAGGIYNISTINLLNTKPYGPQHFPPGGLFLLR